MSINQLSSNTRGRFTPTTNGCRRTNFISNGTREHERTNARTHTRAGPSGSYPTLRCAMPSNPAYRIENETQRTGSVSLLRRARRDLHPAPERSLTGINDDRARRGIPLVAPPKKRNQSAAIVVVLVVVVVVDWCDFYYHYYYYYYYYYFYY